MGNAESLPRDGEVAHHHYTTTTQVAATPPVRPPLGWSEHAAFQIISPASDISNPSQFRHRGSNRSVPLPATAQSRRRKSKVVGSSHRHNKHTPSRVRRTLPLPQRFYFAPSPEHHHRASAGLMHPDWKQRRRKWKAKCQAARRRVALLGDCARNSNSDDDPQQQEPQVQQERRMTTTQRSPFRNNKSSTAVPHEVFSDTTSAKREQEDALVGLEVQAQDPKRISTDTDQSTLPSPHLLTPYVQILQAATSSPPAVLVNNATMQGPSDENTDDDDESSEEDELVLAVTCSQEQQESTQQTKQDTKRESFQPVWKEVKSHDLAIMSHARKPANSYHLHSPADYVQRLVDRSVASTDSKKKSSAPKDMDSPVATLFADDGKPEPKERASQEGMELNNPGIKKRESNKPERKEMESNKPESKEMESNKPEIEGRPIVEPSVTSTITSTSAWSKPVPRVELLGRLSSSSRGSSQTWPSSHKSNQNDEERRRSMVQQQVQHQIDQQQNPKGSRIARIRQQYQKELERISASKRSEAQDLQSDLPQPLALEMVQDPSPQESGASDDRVVVDDKENDQVQPTQGRYSSADVLSRRLSALTDTTTEFANKMVGTTTELAHKVVDTTTELAHKMSNTTTELANKMVAAKANVAATRGRSQSVPRSTSLPCSTTRNDLAVQKRRRSSSLPRRRSSMGNARRRSTDLPGLLHLATAGGQNLEAPPLQNRARKSTELPGLLHMAGWKEPTQQHQSSIEQQRRSSSIEPLKPAALESLKTRAAEPRGSLKPRATEARESLEPAVVENARVTAHYGEKAQEKTLKKSNKTKALLRESIPVRLEAKTGQDDDDKPKRHSDPLPMGHRKPGSITSASILLQTYGFSEDAWNSRRGSAHTAPGALEHKDYRLIAFPLNCDSPPPKQKNIPVVSPSLSECSTSTDGSVPMVSDQALSNAAFMFSPSYVGGGDDTKLLRQVVAGDTKLPRQDRLNTLGSRSRFSDLVSAKPATIPVRPSIDLAPKQRRVRFSDANNYIPIQSGGDYKEPEPVQPTATVDVPALESKLSDLTDITSSVGGGERVSPTAAADGIDSVPEESSVRSVQVSFSSTENSIVVYDDTESVSTASSTKTPLWAYHPGGTDKGVTPCCTGKSASKPTSSPYLRFQEARTKFDGADKTKTEKRVPVKRASLVKSTVGKGFVHSRIAAMEGNKAQKEPVLRPRKARRDTNGYRAIAPKKAVLTSSIFKKKVDDEAANSNEPVQSSSPADESLARNQKQEEESSPFDEDTIEIEPEEVIKSPTLVAGELISSEPITSVLDAIKKFDGKKSDASCGVSSKLSDSSEDDIFAQIMHPTTLDESSGEGGASPASSDPSSMFNIQSAILVDESSEEDDFDVLLQHHNVSDYQSSGDEEDEETVSTIRQDRRGIQYQSSGDEETVSTIRQNRQGVIASQYSNYRLSIGGQSTASASSAGGTVATVRQLRPSQASKSKSLASVTEERSLSKKIQQHQPRLPFREEAPVKPTEQNHRSVPGGLSLSPTQRTPMQARKWRALAAAAQERDSQRHLFGKRSGNKKSLSERSLNVVGR